MVAKTSKIKAAYGRWSYKRKDGDIVEFTGTFPPDRASEAFGTSSFLHRSHMTDTDTQPRPPEKFSDGYVVRLRADWGDNMFKFDHLNDDIKAQRASRGRDNEYRIAVHGRQISRFETDFPQLGNGQVILDKAWLDELQMHSAPSVIPTR